MENKRNAQANMCEETIEPEQDFERELDGMDRSFWIATCIQAVAVLALAVTVLLQVL